MQIIKAVLLAALYVALTWGAIAVVILGTW